MPRCVRHVSKLLLISLACWAVSSVARAEEPYLRFIAALNEGGYGDQAVEYIQQIKGRADLPDEVKEVLDLEMATSMRAWAAQTENTDEAEKVLAQAQTYLDKFLKEHAEHPSAGAAYVTAGDLSFAAAQARWRQAMTREGKQRDELLLSARKAFEAARPRYQQAEGMFKKRLLAVVQQRQGVPVEKGKVPPRRPSRAANLQQQQGEAETALLDVQNKIAQVDYGVGTTYSDPKAPARIAALQKAAAGFDDIFQHYREYRPGMVAHMYHGRVMDEMGDTRTALDIYDEVLQNSPDPGDPRPEPALEALFAQVEYFKLQVLAREGHLDRVLSEGEAWLAGNEPARKTAGYQGVALQIAKAYIAKSEKLPAADKRKALIPAMKLLREVARAGTEFRDEAILLRRKYGGDEELNTVEEALAVGNAASEAQQWDDAISAFEQAITLAKKTKNPEQEPLARFALARTQFVAGKMSQALDTADKLMRDKPQSSVGPSAGTLAVTAALNLYVASRKDAELDRLRSVANYLVKTWPQRAEADDARIALGKVEVVRDEPEKAMEVFENVNPSSDRYPQALTMAGQTHWRMYLAAKNKQQADKAAPHRAKAVEQLTKSVDLQTKMQKPSEPITRDQLETQLLLGEIQLEGNKPAEALKLLEPVIASIKAQNTKTLDTFTLRACVTAVRSAVGVKDMAKAGDVAAILIESGADQPQVNGVLAQFAFSLKKDLQEAEAQVTLAQAGSDAAATKAATANRDATKQLLSKILAQLATRQNNTPAGMIFIGQSAADLGLTKEARQQFELILKKANDDPKFVEGDPKALTRVRARLVGLLRAEGNYDAALTEVNKLIADNPGVMDPLIEKGRILQAAAEKDKKHWPEAVQAWTDLRVRLMNAPRKPPEYYEVVYNAAYCLLAEGMATSDKEKALQGEHILKSVLLQSPTLSGRADMVAKYQVLLNQLIRFQGRVPPPAAAPPDQAKGTAAAAAPPANATAK